MENVSNKNIDGLYLLKGIATVLIVFHHYKMGFKCDFAGPIDFSYGKFYFGLMVELFFMISGFLAVYTLKNNVSYTRQYINKLKRIYPIATIACIFSIAVNCGVMRLNGDSVGLSGMLSFTNLFLNFSLKFQIFGTTEILGINNPTWYLGVLLLCYLVFFMLVSFCDESGIHREAVFIGMIVFFYLFKKQGVFTQNCFRGIKCFFGGAILECLLVRYEEKLIRKKRVVFAAAAGVGIVSLLLIIRGISYSNYPLILGLYPALIIMSFVEKDRHCKGIEYFGKISFEMFVWHSPFTLLIQLLMLVFGFEIRHSYLTMLLYTAVLVVISAGLYRWVELPINRLLRDKHRKPNQENA